MSLQRTTLTGVPFLVENSQVPAKQMLVAAFVHALVFEATGRAKIFAEPFSHFFPLCCHQPATGLSTFFTRTNHKSALPLVWSAPITRRSCGMDVGPHFSNRL